MPVTTARKTALDAFKAWLEAITVGNGYQTDVAEVKRGIHMADEMPNKPALCFWNDKGPVDKYVGGEEGVSDRRLHVFLWGYVNVQPGDYDALDALVSDVEKMINTSHENWEAAGITNIVIGDSTYYEGGASDPIGMFDMEIFITYRFNNNAP